jgi:hypothetical protein
MSSNISPSSGIDPTIVGRPSYESFLRIKQGIGNDALRAAGLPSAEHLSYDAYVTALNRKAAVSRGHETPSPAATPASAKAHSGSFLWTGIVVAPIAIAFVVLLAGILKDHPGDGSIPSPTEAIAAPLTADGLPIALSITATDDMSISSPASIAAAEIPAPEALPSFEAPAPASATPVPVAGTVQPDAPVELLGGKAAKKKKAAAASTEASAATVMPLPERRSATERKKTQSASVKQSAKARQGDDFWQPLVDLLNGKGVRGARNVPAPEDRPGR